MCKEYLNDVDNLVYSRCNFQEDGKKFKGERVTNKGQANKKYITYRNKTS